MEEVDLILERSIGEEDELSAFDGDGIAHGGVEDPLRRIEKRVAVDKGVTGCILRIEHGTGRAAGRDEQILVLNFGFIERDANCGGKSFKDKRFDISFEVAADAFVGIEQGNCIVDPADRGQLLVIQLIIEAGNIVTQAAAQQF